MLDIESLQPAITRLCQRLRVKRLDLFGSATAGPFGPQSDVDVIVEFDRIDGRLFERYFELKEEMERLTARPVDVVMAEAIRNPYFKASVDASRRPLYVA